jgi:hypothetical protein
LFSLPCVLVDNKVAGSYFNAKCLNSKTHSKVTGGNVKYDAGQNIQLNPGFTVDNGVVFSAYIDGCGGQ